MKHDEITPREALATLIGALLMLSVLMLGQLLDAADRREEAERLRARAAQSGFAEGMERMQCMGGIRYDTATGLAVDVQEPLQVTRGLN